MTDERLLRLAAVAIVIAGIADPALTVERAAPREATLAVVTVAGDDDPAAGVQAAADRVREALEATHAVRVTALRPDRGEVACADPAPCVIVTAGQVPDVATGLVFGLYVPVDPPAVRIAAVDVPGEHHASAAARAVVTLDGRGLAGRETLVSIHDDGVPVGSSRHRWREDGPAPVELTWWPAGAGVRRLTVEAATEGEPGVPPVRADAGSEIVTAPAVVLVYDPRPSWGSTFVRRALEADARFEVLARSRLGPSLATSRGAVAFDREALTAAQVVVVGAPEALDGQEADALDWFVRERGGSLVLLPAAELSGQALRWAGPGWRTRLAASPTRIGQLEASEWLEAPEREGQVALAASDSAPVVVARPMGVGRVIVSGALDAWRYRARDEGAFEKFWQGLAAGAAEAAGPAVSVWPAARVVAAGEPVPFEVRVRGRSDGPLAVGASLSCGGGPTQPLRVWPGAARGRLAGVARPTVAGPCEIHAEVAGVVNGRGSAAVLVVEDPARVSAGRAPLARLARASGGEVFDAGAEDALAAAAAAAEPARVAPATVHPMRSPWWIVPLALVCGAEWTLRRRRGRR